MGFVISSVWVDAKSFLSFLQIINIYNESFEATYAYKNIKKCLILEEILITYGHVSQGFATNWAGVMTASVRLGRNKKVS